MVAEVDLDDNLEYRIDSIEVMTTHQYPVDHYIKTILIDSEYVGYCYMNSSKIPQCGLLDCTLVHDRIEPVDESIEVTLIYNQTDYVGICGGVTACATLSLKPVGTGT